MSHDNEFLGRMMQWEDAIMDEALEHKAGPIACGRMIGPYPCCSVVEGDCLELMREIPDGAVDCVIADPPYGMANDADYTRFSGGSTRRGPGSKHKAIVGDFEPFNPSPWLAYPRVILWGANHYWQELPPGGCLVWVKRNDEAFGTFLSDGEVGYLNGSKGVYCYSEVFAGSRKAVEAGFGAYEMSAHPNQKPIGLMQWCIEKANYPDTILDPFCGSGTTLVAAKKLGRHFLGFEISPEYCAIARDRLARIDAQPSLFEFKPEQLKL